MSQALELVRKVLAEPSVEFGQLYLRIDDLNEKSLSETGRCLSSIDASMTWWLGDYMVFYSKHVMEREKKAGAPQEVAEGRANDALREMLVREGGEEERWINAFKLAQFFPAQKRRKLSSKHHIEAMAAADGDLSAAQGWLDLAMKENLSVPDLRQKIRGARAKYLPDGRERTGNGYSAVFNFARFVRQESQRSYDPAQAKAVLQDLSEIIRMAQAWQAQLEAVARAS